MFNNDVYNRMITTFQLRAARSGLGLSMLDLAKETGIGRATLQRLERGHPLDEPAGLFSTLSKLQHYYEVHGIEFTGDSGIAISPKILEIALSERHGIKRKKT